MNKKILTLSILGVLGILTLVWIYAYLHTGKIVVTTNNKYDVITLNKVGDIKFSKKANNQLSVTTKSGQYIASVQGNSVGVSQLIILSGRKTLRYELNPINTGGVEPVAYVSAKNVVADNKQLLYLDSASGNLFKIDSTNNVTNLSPGSSFDNIHWADVSYGIGQDSNGRLNIINNGSASALKTPEPYSNQAVNVAITKNHDLYLSFGKNIYFGNASSGYKKIYTTKGVSPMLATSGGQVAIIDSTNGSNPESPLITATLSIVNSDGSFVKKISVQTTDSLSNPLNAIWSPDGQKLVITNNGSNSEVYSNSLKLLATIPAANISYAAWANNDTVLYSIDDQLWTYSLSSQKAELIANMPLGENIAEVDVSGDGTYAYLTTTSSVTGDSTLRRVGLAGQQTPNFIYQLQDILPLTSADCSVSLINFSYPPALLVIPNPDSSLSPQAYINEAQTELQQDGFDLSKLQFKISPPEGGE